ncbi:hypothetical protein DOMOVOI_01540 [Brevundimonas phage vB_BpoS-Domovoi]|uniref:Uncharacterized protein n=1 Tax=Brevundimonas phage vB_BpoS-Domovoi TaxID=2948598 RepID=A0A9E7MQ77_9CAUD|nr:hypothetical protein DOMOVOI_01540 [Brevundimonas phage vB_BpoS-Domovoi]
MPYFDAETSEDDARAVTEYRAETAARRRRLGYLSHDDARREAAEAWTDFEKAYPQGPDWVRPPEPQLTHEQAQIEQIGRAIWDIFHVRHGGEYDPSGGTVACLHTQSAADRCWAIAQTPEPLSTSLMTALMRDLSDHAHAENWVYLSEVYAARDPTRMSNNEIVTYLRILYCARDKIAAYPDFLNRCRAAMARRGALSELTLRGLDD